VGTDSKGVIDTMSRLVQHFFIAILASLVLLPAAHLSAAAQMKRKYNFGARKLTFDAAKYAPRIVDYTTDEKPGTIIINTRRRYLYLVLGNGKAKRYGIGVGRAGFQWSGEAHVGRKQEWPDWHPPKEMIEREWKKYKRKLPEKMKGGPDNPLGARAMYLFQGNRDTLYRIHGTNAPWSIGRAVSSGCIRLRNEDVIDLYKRVKVGAKVIVK